MAELDFGPGGGRWGGRGGGRGGTALPELRSCKGDISSQSSIDLSLVTDQRLFLLLLLLFLLSSLWHENVSPFLSACRQLLIHIIKWIYKGIYTKVYFIYRTSALKNVTLVKALERKGTGTTNTLENVIYFQFYTFAFTKKSSSALPLFKQPSLIYINRC